VFAAAIAIIALWAISGALFDFSDTWQLVINTATTIVTFLMVFLIQNAEPRHRGDPSEARRADSRDQGSAQFAARPRELEDDEVDRFRRKYQLLADAARRGKSKDVDLTDE
jgi:hypothetical protein